jgi:hypothetical protein
MTMNFGFLEDPRDTLTDATLYLGEVTGEPATSSDPVLIKCPTFDPSTDIPANWSGSAPEAGETVVALLAFDEEWYVLWHGTPQTKA